MQNALGLVLIVTAGYFLWKGTAAGAGGGNGGGGNGGAGAAVQFLNAAGQAITQTTCGETIGFDVPGFSEVWLVQTKDGEPQFNGPFHVPMQPYQLNCATDAGQYIAAVYQRAQSGGPDPGPLIGSARLVVQYPPAGGNGGGVDPGDTLT